MISTESAEKAAALQRYGLLQLQQEYLLQRQSLSAAHGSSTPTSSSRPGSLSPTTPFQPPRSLSISCSDLEILNQSLDAFFPPADTPASPAQDLADDEELMHINMDMKTTLTTLLNNASVRSNGTFRVLIQNRLLQVEQKLKEARKRRSIERRARRKSSGTLSDSSYASVERESSFGDIDDKHTTTFNEGIWRL